MTDSKHHIADGGNSLRDRIAAANKAHRPVYSACYSCTDFNVIDCCECGGWVGGGLLSWEEHLADAVIRELADAIPPIVATAIQGWVLSEWAAISYHGEPGEYEVLKRLDREALQIARYATTHKDWNG